MKGSEDRYSIQLSYGCTHEHFWPSNASPVFALPSCTPATLGSSRGRLRRPGRVHNHCFRGTASHPKAILPRAIWRASRTNRLGVSTFPPYCWPARGPEDPMTSPPQEDEDAQPRRVSAIPQVVGNEPIGEYTEPGFVLGLSAGSRLTNEQYTRILYICQICARTDPRLCPANGAKERGESCPKPATSGNRNRSSSVRHVSNGSGRENERAGCLGCLGYLDRKRRNCLQEQRPSNSTGPVALVV